MATMVLVLRKGVSALAMRRILTNAPATQEREAV